MGRPSLAGPRRKQIIDGLRAAILKHGIADASVQRIAAEAKLPAGLVHHYFVSKEDLLIATVDQVVESLSTPLRAELQVLDPERASATAACCSPRSASRRSVGRSCASASRRSTARSPKS